MDVISRDTVSNYFLKSYFSDSFFSSPPLKSLSVTAGNKGYYLTLLVVESFFYQVLEALKLALLNLHRRTQWRNLISAACVCNLLLLVSSQSFRPQVRIGMKIDD